MKNLKKIETIKRLVTTPRKEPINIEIQSNKGVYHKNTGTLIVLNQFLNDYNSNDFTLLIGVTSLEVARALYDIIEEN